jgi:hypothetical protein
MIISTLSILIGMTIVSVRTYRIGKQRGIREGYHRGRAVNRQEFWAE